MNDTIEKAIDWIKESKESNLKTLLLNDSNLTSDHLKTLIPIIKKELPDLEQLYLSNNSLTYLPKEIADLTELNSLILSDNQLTDLPKELRKLVHLEHLYLSDNQITDLPQEVYELPQLNTMALENNRLSLDTAILLLQNHEANLTTETLQWIDRSYTEDETMVPNQVLESLYGADSAEMSEALEQLNLDSVSIEGGEVKTASEAIEEFLGKIPLEDPIAEKIYTPAAKHFLGQILDNTLSKDKKMQSLQTMATCLGNCATPVKDLLVQTYIGQKIQEGGSLLPFDKRILEREAIEKAIIRKLTEKGLKGPEAIEQVQGLLNAIYLQGAEANPDNKVPITPTEGRGFLPSKTDYIEFAFSQVSEETAAVFTDLCCKTGVDNEPLQEGGLYILDSSKLRAIDENYMADLGVMSQRAKYLEEFQKEMTDLLMENEDLSSLHYDKQDVLEALNTPQQKEKLKALLYAVEDGELQEVYKSYLDRQKSEILKLTEKYETNSSVKFPDLSQMTSPQNASKRLPDKSRSIPMPSPTRPRYRKTGPNL
ncbi:MAG: leucine-rich repeat domain-containing protein [Bacteroidota bacterium]